MAPSCYMRPERGRATGQVCFLLCERNSASVLAEGTQNNGAANAETDYGSQSGQHQVARAEVKDVGEDRRQRENQAGNIQPEWSADGSAPMVAQAQLQQNRGQPNGGQNYDRQGTRKGRVPRVDNHKRQGEKEQAGGNQSPATRFVLRTRIGSGIGQGVVPSYTRHGQGFQTLITAGVPQGATAGDARGGPEAARTAMGGQFEWTMPGRTTGTNSGFRRPSAECHLPPRISPVRDVRTSKPEKKREPPAAR